MAKALKVVPDEDDYVFQANDLARSAHKTPVLERRLVFLAMAQIRPDQEDPSLIEMTAIDVRKALGMANSGGYRDELKDAALNLRQQAFLIERPNGDWLACGWVDRVAYIKSRDVIQIKLSDETMSLARALAAGHAKLQIADIAKLQSRYALRIFEIIMADHGHAGRDGNNPGGWFTDLMFEDLRIRFQILPNEYSGRNGTNDFRKRIIDLPIQEINSANIGLKITPDYDRFRDTSKRGHPLMGVRLNVQIIPRNEPKVVNKKPVTKTEKEAQSLRDKHREKWEELLAIAKSQGDLFRGGPTDGLDELIAEAQADEALAKWLKKQSSKR